MDLRERCEAEFTKFVEGLFEADAKLPGAGFFPTAPFIPTPIIGGRYFAGIGTQGLQRSVINALTAAELFRQEKPDWAPADLPLTSEACEALEDDDDPRMNLVGHFGASLRLEFWAPIHPPFHRFCCGIMAAADTPDEFRNDPGLQVEFPPQELAGCQELIWLSPETLALNAYVNQLAKSMGV